MASLLFMIEQRRGSVLWGSTLYTRPAQPEEELLHLLNPKKWTKLCGAHIDHISYSAYGKVTAESNSSNGDRFKFTGREYDSDSNLHYFRSRFNDPVVGRF